MEQAAKNTKNAWKLNIAVLDEKEYREKLIYFVESARKHTLYQLNKTMRCGWFLFKRLEQSSADGFALNLLRLTKVVGSRWVWG